MGRNLFSASSREKEKVPWVRSLVPKEKNSARLRQPGGPDAGPGDFHHGAELIFNLDVEAFFHFLVDIFHPGLHPDQLLAGADVGDA